MFDERNFFAWNKLEPYVDVHFAEAKTESRCSPIIIVFFTLRHEKMLRLVGSCNQTEQNLKNIVIVLLIQYSVINA